MSSLATSGHLQRRVTTLCHCWRLTRRDGTVFGFTDHDGPITVDGTECRPESGLAASELHRPEGMAISAADVEGALSSELITETDILDGLYDGATVETFLVNWRQPAEHARTGAATISKLTRADGAFVAEVEGPGRDLDLVRGRHVKRHCDAELGDARCGVALDGPEFVATGEVVSFDGISRLVVSGLDTFAHGWFAKGVLTWNSGGLEGRSERVVDFRHDGAGTVVVFWPARSTLPQAGDVFEIVAGCDKSFATCKAKFANPVNFRGFPHLPGNDSAYAYVTEEGEFDGGPLVP